MRAENNKLYTVYIYCVMCINTIGTNTNNKKKDEDFNIKYMRMCIVF